MTRERPESESGPVPDTGMATGNDDPEPGERFRGRPLDAEERAVLADLRSGDGDQVVTEAAEDSPAMTEAVENDSVVRDPD
jgi:hypothetical protein